jgi:hypothetical protein
MQPIEFHHCIHINFLNCLSKAIPDDLVHELAKECLSFCCAFEEEHLYSICLQIYHKDFMEKH